MNASVQSAVMEQIAIRLAMDNAWRVVKAAGHEKTPLEIQTEFLEAAETFVEPYLNDLAAVFGAIEKEVVKNIRNTPKAFYKQDYDIDAWLFNRQKWVGTFDAATRKMDGAVVPQFAERFLADTLAVGTSFNLVDRRALTWMAQHSLRLATEVTKETYDQLKETLMAGLADGLSIPNITRGVMALFEDMSKSRAESIARTEVLKASNRGNYEGMRQSGVVEGQQWMATIDAKTCEKCEQMEGKTSPLEKPFIDKGQEVEWKDGTSELFDYEEIMTPPLHVRCRCTTTAILKEVEVNRAASQEGVGRDHFTIDDINRSKRSELRDEAVKQDYFKYYGKMPTDQEVRDMRSGITWFTLGGQEGDALMQAQLGNLKHFGRSRVTYEQAMKWANGLEDYLKIAPKYQAASGDTALYRGLTKYPTPMSQKFVGSMQRVKVGDVLESQLTQHWTSNAKVADDFAQDVLIECRSAVDKAASIKHLSSIPFEDEVCVSKAVKFRVVSVSTEKVPMPIASTTRTHIIVEAIR